MENNLNQDPSPYLQQHKNNPVNWQTWSSEILKLAKNKKKPILLSVGYASCHWCHVMAHESFEDEETAKIMNENFINIKVDREERPDIDFVFQSSYQIFNQAGGGWPLTMFLDENAIPFMAGTYFPKIEKNGMPSFINVLNKVAEVYKEQRLKIIEQKKIILNSLELKKNPVLKQDLESIMDSVISNLDENNGGYKGAPKFPTFYVFETLLYFYNKTKKEKYVKPVKILIDQLCSKGIYDHVEGGISRYAVDENWLVPHFEKMLYDNAQFILLLSKFVKINKKKYYTDKIIQTISYLGANFKIKNSSLLGSAYDADSEGEEGKYYTFSYEEIKDIVNIDKFFDIRPEGNWEGKIILKENNYPSSDVIESLYKIRKKRVKPFFDNKIQLDLNSLWVSALLSANQVLPEKKYLKEAENLYLDIEKKFLDNKIFHSNSESVVFIEDYAFVINCLNDLYDATLNPKYKIKSLKIAREAIDNFYIKEKKIFQKNKILTNDLFLNPIDVSDHTIPNGNSTMLLNFVRLGMKNEAEELAVSLNGYLNSYKNFMTSSVKSIDFYNEITNGNNCNEQGCKI
jgi:uncharacterized protein YyaL (SSP411 family)